MPLPNPNYQLAIPLEALHLKIRHGYSPLVCIVGDETGIGKSRVGLRISELIYWRTYIKKWEMQKSVFFSMTKFKDKLFDTQGEIFIIEEAEIELGSDDWQSISNRWFSRIKDTQRIKGNIYIIVLPMFMALAKKHRRRINYIIDVKGRGFANFWKIKKRSAELMGDELSKTFIGSVILSLPECDKEFEIIDRLNKQRIEKEQGELFDKELRYKELVREKKIMNIEKTLSKEKQTNLYTYRCHACKFIFNSDKPIDKVITCKNCHKAIYVNEQNLIQSPDSKIELSNDLNNYEDEN